MSYIKAVKAVCKQSGGNAAFVTTEFQQDITISGLVDHSTPWRVVPQVVNLTKDKVYGTLYVQKNTFGNYWFVAGSASVNCKLLVPLTNVEVRRVRAQDEGAGVRELNNLAEKVKAYILV